MLLLQLFFSFIQVGLFSVGGGYAAIPLIQNQIVDIHGLMTLEEFTDLITIAEMTPGPISINSATFVGMRLAGIPGVILCTFGCILPAFVICSLLAYFYYKYRKLGAVQTILASLRPAVVALIASAGLSILLLALRQINIICRLMIFILWKPFYLWVHYLFSESTKPAPLLLSLEPEW